MANILVFDVETVPDAVAGRRLYGLDGLDDEGVVQAMRHMRSQETGGSDFQRHHLHRIVAISVLLRRGESVSLFTLGEPKDDEAGAVARFFDGVERFTPVLVSWNGSGFDLPVLHYRALLHGISAPRYWETGDEDRSFRYNNYLSRFHWRHLDLMDVLAGFSPRANAPLDEIATLLDFPGKMGLHGSRVWEAYRDGQLEAIRSYCEIDVLNTYLIYLRFELLRGRLTRDGWRSACEQLKDALESMQRPHLDEFLQKWRME